MRARTELIGKVSRHMPMRPRRSGSNARSVCSKAMCPNTGMAPSAMKRERGRGGRGGAEPDGSPTRAEGARDVGGRRRERGELPDRGHPVRDQLAAADEQERDRDRPCEER